ncbi:lipase member H-like [Chironomus tepperi]|uniref:lipase member H-like n=1 Tax=Chironomus tepperi TaxID=113505 RepID=UPI00391F4ECF
MKLIIFCLVIKATISVNFDSAYLAFIGSNYNDYKIFREGLNFNEVINENYFNISRPSVFITHGWRDGFREEFGKVMVEAYLYRNDSNIIFGDWSFYSPFFNYIAVAGSVPELAKTFLKYLNKIKQTGYDLKQIHFVGHSLGAHVFGKIGEILKADNIFLPRITGLDPAGPTFNVEILIKMFMLSFKVPSNPGLRKGNARFVDIIHTDAGLVGTTASTGDLDFWANGGKNQPSCNTCPSANGDVGIGCISCHHSTSWRYYAESVRSLTPLFTSLRCTDGVHEYKEENCRGPETASMGFYASSDSRNGNYFIKTNAVSPFSH